MEALILTIVLLVIGTLLGALGTGGLLVATAVAAVVVGLCVRKAPNRKEN